VTTYARATTAYDDAHERALAEAIVRAIAEASPVSANLMVVRTGEAASALLTCLARPARGVARGDPFAHGAAQDVRPARQAAAPPPGPRMSCAITPFLMAQRWCKLV